MKKIGVVFFVIIHSLKPAETPINNSVAFCLLKVAHFYTPFSFVIAYLIGNLFSWIVVYNSEPTPQENKEYANNYYLCKL